jgi:hypothetical protein
VTGVSTLLLIYLLLIMLLPHTRPPYLPVEDLIVLHIDNFFALAFSIESTLDILAKNSCKSFKVTLFFDYFTLVTDSTVVEPPVPWREDISNSRLTK